MTAESGQPKSPRGVPTLRQIVERVQQQVDPRGSRDEAPARRAEAEAFEGRRAR